MVDQGREGVLSPFLREQRFKAVAPYLKGRVLDFGCGAGELCQQVAPEYYVGVDSDVPLLNQAKQRFPDYRFLPKLPDAEERFDTIVALAVIEHVADAAQTLKDLAQRLNTQPLAQIVCTTPHPAVEWVHTAGATVGLFSRQAHEEHEQLLGPAQLPEVAARAGLHITSYSRFLYGANQLVRFAVLKV